MPRTPAARPASIDPFIDNIPLPMSQAALDAFNSLSYEFMEALSTAQRIIVLNAFLFLDFVSKGQKTPRDLQLRAAIAVGEGKNLLVRSGTGSGKTLAMIIPVLLLPKDAIVITVSPLRLIQDNHVTEFSKYGIPSIAINSFTPEDPNLWKLIRNREHYHHYSVSPEQCGIYKGHVPRFARLLHDSKWVKKIKLLQIDEAHFVETTGQAKGDEAAFRPAYSDLGERLRVHLPTSTPCTAYSASMPGYVMDLLMKTLRMDAANTIKLELTTNRPNLIYATIPIIGSIDNFRNLDFFFPTPIPPSYRPPKSIIFLDNKLKAAKLARHLNAKASPEIGAVEPFRHYHSTMSKPYLEHIIKSFKEEDEDVRCLVATEAASNGFDVADIRLIVMFGVPKTKFEEDQRGGRGGRDGLPCLVLTIAEKWALENLAATDPVHTPSKKELRTEAGVIADTHSKPCRRRALADHNNDKTPTALDFTMWCCDNHDDHNFDISVFLPGSLPTEADHAPSGPPTKTTRRKYRPVAARQELIDCLEEWRMQRHADDPIARHFRIGDILETASIPLLARQPRHSLRIPADITSFLQETEEWHREYALDILSIIIQYDGPRPTSAALSSGDSSESSSDSHPDSDSPQDTDDSEIPPPRSSRRLAPVPTFSDSDSSPEYSPQSSPQPSCSPSPQFNANGRRLRRAAMNHQVAGIAHQVAKRQKTLGQGTE
ncbi:P-loop containing nucleoside triphosphate hydrolase protein [Mycena maculata]|uniref:DNA 3'-5' helicase n=1 Tax=Mycena maculata TaxID=230809 RepID=A0AAD7NFE0_9AGAR|nr:P-loop containing nucleoside triphosphate hydrolase protein [Mycena maculata]